MLIGAAVVAIVVVAPWLMQLYGADFRNESTDVLRLLVIGAIPQTVLNLYQAIERTRGHGGRILAITTARLIAVLFFVIALAGPFELAGVGWGWVIGHFVVMLAVAPSLYRLMRKA